MSTQENPQNKTRIAFIGKFGQLYDEEYIARSFEMINCEVMRIPLSTAQNDMERNLIRFKPHILLYCKWEQPASMDKTINLLKRGGMTTVCWLFDLYWGYPREYQLKTHRFFRSDYVFTTDGGDHPWKELGINHLCVRQGVYKPHCFMEPANPVYDVIFIGSQNPYFTERTEMMTRLSTQFNFKWFGRTNTDEIRDEKLNKTLAESKVVVGDSVYSPNYWSNRVVETLGRGGFLIHRDVPGLKEEYPDLVTYKGDIEETITYYLRHDKEREELRKKNFEWVRDNYTMDRQCQNLLNFIS